MQEKVLLWSYLGVSIIGLLALAVLLQVARFEPVRITALKDNMGEDVEIVGRVLSVDSQHGFIQVAQTEKVTVVVFDRRLLGQAKPGQDVKVQGEVRKYKETPQLIAQRITPVSLAQS